MSRGDEPDKQDQGSKEGDEPREIGSPEDGTQEEHDDDEDEKQEDES